MSKTIALLSRYPPLEGGIAAKTYWMARGLASAGHNVHVITHGLKAGGEYRIQGEEGIPSEVPNLWVHRPQDDIPWHIPEDNEQSLKLLDLTIEVMREYKVQILDTGYLVPYGIIGHFAKLSTGVPHVIRHGGSDIEKFLKQGILGKVLSEAISGADVVITENRYRELLESKSSHLVCQPPYIPDETAFAPDGNNRLRKRLAWIGKVNYHWQHKNLPMVVEIMRHLTGQFDCCVVGQGNGLSDFQDSLGSETVSHLRWCSFVPPWEMAGLLSELDGIFIFESALPHPVVSNLALEAVSSGVGIITDRADFAETYQEIVDLSSNEVLVVSPSNPSSAAQMITEWIRQRTRASGASSRQFSSYRDYISATESVYQQIPNGRQS